MNSLIRRITIASAVDFQKIGLPFATTFKKGREFGVMPLDHRLITACGFAVPSLSHAAKPQAEDDTFPSYWFSSFAPTHPIDHQFSVAKSELLNDNIGTVARGLRHAHPADLHFGVWHWTVLNIVEKTPLRGPLRRLEWLAVARVDAFHGLPGR